MLNCLWLVTEQKRIMDILIKGLFKKRPNFCYKDFIVHFKHCPLQSSPLYWRFTVPNISSIVEMLPGTHFLWWPAVLLSHFPESPRVQRKTELFMNRGVIVAYDVSPEAVLFFIFKALWNKEQLSICPKLRLMVTCSTYDKLLVSSLFTLSPGEITCTINSEIDFWILLDTVLLCSLWVPQQTT